jgi:hypothetical protein
VTYFLLTWHGFFVGSRPNCAVRFPTDGLLGADQLLCVEVPSLFDPDSFSDFLGNTPPEAQEVVLPGVGDFLLRPQELSNVVALQRDDRYLSARPDGSLACNRETIGGWERFVLVSKHSFQQLQQIMTNTWIVGSSRILVPSGDLRIEDGPSLIIGPLKLPLGPNLPFEDHFAPFRFPVHPDGWKFDQIILYRPLIFYVAFGENSVGQACVSINSLFQIGKYDSRVLVFTDTPELELRRSLVEIAPGQLLVAPHPANEWVGFVAGKYAILEEEVAHLCSPVVYMDPDIVCNADVHPILVDMACAGRPSAPLEHFSNLALSPSVGGQLIQRDNGNPILSHGFNAGTLAVPNLKEFGHVLAIIRRTIRNYLSIHGRDGLQYVDQEVANYISYKFAHFDTGQVTRYVRTGWIQDASTLGTLSGLVHFCGIGRASRTALMQQYLDLLLDYYSPLRPL